MTGPCKSATESSTRSTSMSGHRRLRPTTSTGAGSVCTLARSSSCLRSRAYRRRSNTVSLHPCSSDVLSAVTNSSDSNPSRQSFPGRFGTSREYLKDRHPAVPDYLSDVCSRRSGAGQDRRNCAYTLRTTPQDPPNSPEPSELSLNCNASRRLRK